MKQVPTLAQYQARVRAMPTRELEGLVETFEHATAINSAEALIKGVLDAEMERRILQWEAE